MAPTRYARLMRLPSNVERVPISICLYSHAGKYLLVRNTPVEVCLNCGMVYYDAAVLKEIERRFFAIEHEAEKPDRYIRIPEKAYA